MSRLLDVSRFVAGAPRWSRQQIWLRAPMVDPVHVIFRLDAGEPGDRILVCDRGASFLPAGDCETVGGMMAKDLEPGQYTTCLAARLLRCHSVLPDSEIGYLFDVAGLADSVAAA